jgi:hypothetical protein
MGCRAGKALTGVLASALETHAVRQHCQYALGRLESEQVNAMLVSLSTTFAKPRAPSLHPLTKGRERARLATKHRHKRCADSQFEQVER